MSPFFFFFFWFICTIVSFSVKAPFHVCIWCRCELIVQCHCVRLLMPRKERMQCKGDILLLSVSEFLFSHYNSSLYHPMFFKSGCLVHVGTIKYKVVLNVWPVYFLRLRAGEEDEGERGRSGALLALLPTAAWRSQSPQHSHAHTHRNTPHPTAWPAIWWPTSELHLCLPQGSYSISTKPQRQQVTYMHRWLLESTDRYTIKCCCYKLKALLRQVRQTGNKKTPHLKCVLTLSEPKLWLTPPRSLLTGKHWL